MVENISGIVQKLIGLKAIAYKDASDLLDEVESLLPPHNGPPAEDPRLMIINTRMLACEVYRRPDDEVRPLLREFWARGADPRWRLTITVAHCRIWPEMREEFLPAALSELQSLDDPEMVALREAALTMQHASG